MIEEGDIFINETIQISLPQDQHVIQLDLKFVSF